MGRQPPGLLLLALLTLGCEKTKAAATAASEAPAVRLDASPDAAPPATEDPAVTDLWARAAEGEGDDLARLAAAVGSDGLVEAIPSGARRLTALRALAFADDFTSLPALAKVATVGNDAEAEAALRSVASMTDEPRRATDPEDAIEIRDGTRVLVSLVKETTTSPARRVLAESALRRLAERGWVAPGDIPSDVDAH